MTDNRYIKLLLWGAGCGTMDKCEKAADALVAKGFRRQSEGEWRFIENMMCECSACNDCFNYYSSTDLPNYCPNCGARLKGGAE